MLLVVRCCWFRRKAGGRWGRTKIVVATHGTKKTFLSILRILLHLGATYFLNFYKTVYLPQFTTRQLGLADLIMPKTRIDCVEKWNMKTCLIMQELDMLTIPNFSYATDLCILWFTILFSPHRVLRSLQFLVISSSSLIK